MILSSILAAAALAASAGNAFLLPPEMEGTVSPFDLHDINVGNTFEVACTGCPFALGEKDGKITWVDGVESSLSLNFSLKHDKIFLNDKLFYPMQFPHLEAFSAPQIRKSESDTLPQQTVSIPFAYALDTTPGVSDEAHDEFTLQLTIFDLAGRQVRIDTVRIRTSKNKQGVIPLMVIDKIAADAPGSPSALGPECTNSICRMRAIIFAKIKEALQKAKDAAAAAKAKGGEAGAWIKGCHNKFRGGHRPHHGKGPGDHGRPHHPHHHDRPHHHGHHHKGFAPAVAKVFHFIVIPVLGGVLAGMTAAMVGFMVGRMIGYLWVKFARGGRRGPYSRVTLEEEVLVDDEKDGLMTESEMPPEYEELPAEAVKLADEKH